MVYSNFRRITHRFRDTSCFDAENHIFACPHLYLTLNLKVRVIPLEYGDEIWQQKTRIMGLPYGEEIVIVSHTMWTQSMSVMDRQTDRFSITKTALYA